MANRLPWMSVLVVGIASLHCNGSAGTSSGIGAASTPDASVGGGAAPPFAPEDDEASSSPDASYDVGSPDDAPDARLDASPDAMTDAPFHGASRRVNRRGARRRSAPVGRGGAHAPGSLRGLGELAHAEPAVARATQSAELRHVDARRRARQRHGSRVAGPVLRRRPVRHSLLGPGRGVLPGVDARGAERLARPFAHRDRVALRLHADVAGFEPGVSATRRLQPRRRGVRLDVDARRGQSVDSVDGGPLLGRRRHHHRHVGHRVHPVRPWRTCDRRAPADSLPGGSRHRLRHDDAPHLAAGRQRRATRLVRRVDLLRYLATGTAVVRCVR